MLVLKREIRQGVRIGDDILVQVLGIEDDGQVKLGFLAPKSTRILREEKWNEQQVNRGEQDATDEG
jgi:carbon storage regulator CsrA